MKAPSPVPNVLVGSRAPDFAMPCAESAGGVKTVRCADYIDRWLALVFYPRDFSLVCPTELTAISDRARDFASRDCEVLAVSTDPVETHLRWMETARTQGGVGNLRFPLASDESGEVCRAYGVYVPRQNVALRGLFVIDPNGVIQYQVVHNLSVGRSVDELLRVVDALQSGGMCPESWSAGSPAIDPVKELGPGRVVGPYHIEAEIGRGAFGAVFRANDTVLNRSVALKVIRSDANQSTEQVLNEARAVAALNHPNVCTIHTVDNSAGVPVIVMELIDGQTLSDLLSEGPLPRDQVIRLARQIAGGLAAAHQIGIIHGDLKPANILIRKDGAAKLTDFGLSRRASPVDLYAETLVINQPTTGGITGTPYYLSPEQARGAPASPESDVFSFGLIHYEMLTGRRAVSGESLLGVLNSAATLDVQSLTRSLNILDAELLQQLLSISPEDRPLSCHLVEML